MSDHDAALTSFDAWFGCAFQRDAEARFESAAALAEAFAVAASQAPMRDQNASHASA